MKPLDIIVKFPPKAKRKNSKSLPKDSPKITQQNYNIWLKGWKLKDPAKY